MRKSGLLLVAITLAVLLAGGVALAAEIACPTGENGRCEGTQEDDSMTGTDGLDRIEGLAGNDTLYGGRFLDYLWGGPGNDTIYGNGGESRIYGDDTTFTGVGGRDRLVGGPRTDLIYGGPGADRIKGNPGNDVLYGLLSSNLTDHDADGGDTILGGEGNDEIAGRAGNDVLYGEAGNDTIYGVVTFEPDTSFDRLYGGEGGDRLYSVGGRVEGGPGSDEFSVFHPCDPDRGCEAKSVTFEAVDGQRDEIYCTDAWTEIVRADPLDVFPPQRSYSTEPTGREYCDSVTIVEE